MPRSRSSGALSIWSKAMYLLAALALANTLVMAAVKVVLPWSMCPIVPTFTCGFVRSNLFFAIFSNGSFCSFLRSDNNFYGHAAAVPDKLIAYVDILPHYSYIPLKWVNK